MDSLYSIVLFGLGAFLVLWIAKSKGFFVLPFEKRAPIPISLKAVLILFGLYLSITLLFAPLLLHIVHIAYAKVHPGDPPPIGTLSVIQLLIIASILLLFFLYSRANDAAVFKKIWKNWDMPHASPIPVDIGMGMLAWLIGFPLVALIGEIVDLLIYLFCGVENYEQVAVRYLKTSLSSVETMIIPLFIILLAAPVIEEFLFRGCLQTYLKKYIGIKKAIALSSLCFALFHYAPSQGMGNISLLVSLFTFALFLGFIYERQGSLFASIGLHVTFNTFSTIRILFFAE